jgi:hypothetical protein
MFKSDAERVIRRAMEESGAEFTEEQIDALCTITTKIAALIVEEAFSNWRPGTTGKPGFFSN